MKCPHCGRLVGDGPTPAAEAVYNKTKELLIADPDGRLPVYKLAEAIQRDLGLKMRGRAWSPAWRAAEELGARRTRGTYSTFMKGVRLVGDA